MLTKSGSIRPFLLSHHRVEALLFTAKYNVSHVFFCCCCSVIKSGQTLCDTPSFSVFHYLPEFSQTHVHLMSRLSDAIQSSHPLLSPSPFALNLSQPSGSFPMSRLFASDGQSTGASASAISPSNEYLELISFRIDWFHLLVVQGTLNSLLQHHSLKASILRHSTFLMVQLSHLYVFL